MQLAWQPLRRESSHSNLTCENLSARFIVWKEIELKPFFMNYRIIKVINHHFTAVLSSERHQSKRTLNKSINVNKTTLTRMEQT